MKKIMLLALTGASALAFASPAMADNPNGDIPGCDPSGQSPQKCDGDVNNGGAGGAGGSVVGSGNSANVNTNTATGGNATNTTVVGQSTEVSNSQSQSSENTNSNNSSATGGAGGNASATGGNGGSANNGGVNNTLTWKDRRQAPQAYAPTVMVGQCQKSLSGGISTPFGGFSLGGSRGDQWCQLVQMMGFATETLGRSDLACNLLYYNDKRFAEAMRHTGVGCPAYVAK